MTRWIGTVLWTVFLVGSAAAQDAVGPADALLQAIRQNDWVSAASQTAALPSPLTAEEQARVVSALDEGVPGAPAVPVLRAWVESYPANARLQLQLARAYEQTGDADAALQAGAAAIANATEDTDLFYRVAVLAEALERYDEAERYLKTLLAREPRHLEGLFLSGHIALARGNDLKAREFFQQVIDLDPNHYMTRFELGHIEIRVGNNAEAERHLRMAIQAYPFYREAYNALLIALARQRKRDEIRQFQSIVNKMNEWDSAKFDRLYHAYLNPTVLSPEDAYEFAASLFQVGRDNYAKAFLEKAVAAGKVIEPELYLLAQLRYRAKDYQGCLELLERVHYETATQSVTYAALKAWSLYFLNRYEESRQYSETVKPAHGQSNYFTSLQVALDQVLSPTGVASATEVVSASGTIPILSPFHFADVTEKAGLHVFTHRQGQPDKKWIVESLGSGVAVADYDRDGDEDLFFVNGRPDWNNADPQYKDALFRNEGGTFVDVTDAAGVGDVGYGFCAAFGDVNNDGWPDLYVGNYGKNTLYLNNGAGAFTDITEQAQVGDPGFTTSVSFADVDKDGDLDLFVGNYVEFTPSAEGLQGRFHGLSVLAGPLAHPPQADHLYLNNGSGVFEDASAKAWKSLAPGRTLGSAFFDLENDGDLDLYISNDSSYNYVLANKGDGTFDDISFASGGALTEYNIAGGSQGVVTGDYNNDGLLDLYLTSPDEQPDTMFKNEGNQTLTDFSAALGLASSSLSRWTWGAGFADFDSDGRLDLFTAGGHAYPQVESLKNGRRYAQGVALYRNDGSRFQDVTASLRWENYTPRPGRGAALIDFDNDGDQDIVLNAIDSPPQLLENRSPQGRWLQVVLDAPSTFTSGVRVVARKGTQTWTRCLNNGAGYLSQSAAKLHFGFGSLESIDDLTVYWLHRAPQTVPAPPLNAKLVVPLPAQ